MAGKNNQIGAEEITH